jgi:hypothetical protein
VFPLYWCPPPPLETVHVIVTKSSGQRAEGGGGLRSLVQQTMICICIVLLRAPRPYPFSRTIYMRLYYVYRDSGVLQSGVTDE